MHTTVGPEWRLIVLTNCINMQDIIFRLCSKNHVFECSMFPKTYLIVIYERELFLVDGCFFKHLVHISIIGNMSIWSFTKVELVRNRKSLK